MMLSANDYVLKCKLIFNRNIVKQRKKSLVKCDGHFHSHDTDRKKAWLLGKKAAVSFSQLGEKIFESKKLSCKVSNSEKPIRDLWHNNNTIIGQLIKHNLLSRV